jgi:hypothetical protein
MAQVSCVDTRKSSGGSTSRRICSTKPSDIPAFLSDASWEAVCVIDKLAYAVYDDIIVSPPDLTHPRLLHVQRLLMDPHLHYLLLYGIGLVAEKLHTEKKGQSAVGMPATSWSGPSSSSSKQLQLPHYHALFLQALRGAAAKAGQPTLLHTDHNSAVVIMAGAAHMTIARRHSWRLAAGTSLWYNKYTSHSTSSTTGHPSTSSWLQNQPYGVDSQAEAQLSSLPCWPGGSCDVIPAAVALPLMHVTVEMLLLAPEIEQFYNGLQLLLIAQARVQQEQQQERAAAAAASGASGLLLLLTPALLSVLKQTDQDRRGQMEPSMGLETARVALAHLFAVLMLRSYSHGAHLNAATHMQGCSALSSFWQNINMLKQQAVRSSLPWEHSACCIGTSGKTEGMECRSCV